MKYCTHCGAEMCDEAVICMCCGCEVNAKTAVGAKDDIIEIIIKIFLILGCISIGWLIIPLAWCIPMTVAAFKKLKTGEKFGTGLKVCILLFVSLVAGICLLCMEE